MSIVPDSTASAVDHPTTAHPAWCRDCRTATDHAGRRLVAHRHVLLDDGTRLVDIVQVDAVDEHGQVLATTTGPDIALGDGTFIAPAEAAHMGAALIEAATMALGQAAAEPAHIRSTLDLVRAGIVAAARPGGDR